MTKGDLERQLQISHNGREHLSADLESKVGEYSTYRREKVRRVYWT
jgi:hypothetical protein